LADEKLLDTVCGTNLCDELGDFGVPVASVATDNEERALDALGDRLEDAGDEGLSVVFLLEDLDLLSQARTSSELAGVNG
jgi:hypothetical protein